MNPGRLVSTALVSGWMLVGAVHLAATIARWEPLRSRTKLVMMPYLAAWVLVVGGGRAWGLAVALLLAAAGDACLLRKDRSHYLACGLAAFLMMHVGYVVIFLGVTPSRSWGFWWVAVLVVCAVAIWFYQVLRPALGRLRIPVAVYLLVISLMVVSALRLAEAGLLAGWMVAFGAVMFMVSDSLLAVRLFLGGSEGLAGWVTGSYLLSQGLISCGLLQLWH